LPTGYTLLNESDNFESFKLLYEHEGVIVTVKTFDYFTPNEKDIQDAIKGHTILNAIKKVKLTHTTSGNLELEILDKKVFEHTEILSWEDVGMKVFLMHLLENSNFSKYETILTEGNEHPCIGSDLLNSPLGLIYQQRWDFISEDGKSLIETLRECGKAMFWQPRHSTLAKLYRLEDSLNILSDNYKSFKTKALYVVDEGEELWFKRINHSQTQEFRKLISLNHLREEQYNVFMSL
ncbi:MAG: hypothetical protein AAF378_25310, partial [Cyanobacteria bacterium P01_A01_bin.84]